MERRPSDACIVVPTVDSDLRQWAKKLAKALEIFAAEPVPAAAPAGSLTKAVSRLKSSISMSSQPLPRRQPPKLPAEKSKPDAPAAVARPVRPAGPPPASRLTVEAVPDAHVRMLNRNKSMPIVRPKPLPATPAVPATARTPPTHAAAPVDQYSSVPLMSSFKPKPKQYGSLEPETLDASGPSSEIFDELPPLPEEHMELCGFSEVFERVIDLEDDDDDDNG